MKESQPIGKSIAQVLTERKEALGMTDDQIAEIIGRTGSYVGLLRKGTVGTPQIDTVFSLVTKLGIPLEKLIPGYEQVFKLAAMPDLAPFLHDTYGINGKERIAEADRLLSKLAQEAQREDGTELLRSIQGEHNSSLEVLDVKQDERLLSVVQCWSQLTDEERQAIFVLVKAIKLIDSYRYQTV